MTQDVHKTPSSQILANVAAAISVAEDKESPSKSSSISKKDQQAIKDTTSNITRLANSKSMKNDKTPSQEKPVAEKLNQQESFSETLKTGQDILQTKAQESLEQLKKLLNVMQEASLEMNCSVEKVCASQIQGSRQVHSTLLDAFQKASHLNLDSLEEIVHSKNVGDVMNVQLNWLQNMPALYTDAVKNISSQYMETLKKCSEETKEFMSKAAAKNPLTSRK